jgi:Protein of unknown function (DUF2846)
MKHRFSWCIIVISAALLVSCASGIPFTKLNPSLGPEVPNSGRIFFYRATGFGAAIRPDIIMNGEKVGTSIAEGFFYVDRPAGEYTVVTSTEVKRKVSFVLDKGQTRYIRFKVGFGFFVGHVYGQLVDADEAKKEIEQCKYTPYVEKKS